MRHYTITDQEAETRLDRYLSRVKPDLTRTFIQKLIRSGSVFVNHKKIIKPAHRLSDGDKLIVAIPSIKETGIQPEKIPLDIVYEDRDLIVVNKPAGMVVHPTDHGAHVSGTLVNAVLWHCKNLSRIGDEKRPGIVHRLDKDTSGLIIVAKNDRSHRALAKQFEERKVEKKYLALLNGHLKPKEGSIEASLLKGREKVRISARKKAKYALTHYKVLQYIDQYTLVEVHIVTGRTHQIRVHFAAIGHPVCGDTQYGDTKVNEKLQELGLNRQFLHAEYIKFRHPKKNKIIEMRVPLPDELEDILKKIA